LIKFFVNEKDTKTINIQENRTSIAYLYSGQDEPNVKQLLVDTTL